ncbi:MAG: DUF6510 family protein [Promicromonosporaceae bacterium]|nr:DUF6510 family protein [Promicromonosporaceae bacterium]
MTHLDGNALAGVLAEVFAVDLTDARARCTGCGNVGRLAEAMLYTGAPGLVARCAGCDQVLATVVDSGDRLWLSLTGLSAIELRR